MKYSKKKEV